MGMECSCKTGKNRDNRITKFHGRGEQSSVGP